MQTFKFVHPLGITARCLAGARSRQAETLQIDQPPDSLGPHACVNHGHIAAHAVADQINRLAGGVVVQQKVQVGQVVGKPEVVGLTSAGLAKAAPVGRDDASACGKGLWQGIDHELVRGGHVHPTVQQHQRRAMAGAGIVRTPAQYVVFQAPYRDKLGAGSAFFFVH